MARRRGVWIGGAILLGVVAFELGGLLAGTMGEPRFAAPEILAEETEWAAGVTQQRQEVSEAEERRETIDRVLRFVVGPLVVVAALAFWLIWQRWGRDPEPPDDIGDYWREVPDDPPAVAAAFLGWRTVDADAYSATLLDLARRGHLRIEEVPVERTLRSDTVEHRFVATGTTPDRLRPFETRVLDWLFDDGPVIDQSALVRRNTRRQREASDMWEGFKTEVLADLDARRYVERDKGVPIALHLAIVAALVAVTVFAVVIESWIPAGVAGVAAVVLVPLTFLHLSRTEVGARRHAEWTALRRYLSDFSRLDEAPVGHLALWESYLVAAVALGVADELIAGLEVRFPELMQEGSGFAPWYVVAAGSPHGGIGYLGSFSSDAGRPAVISFSPASSGAGAGGGFSAGGGGGGGGGSFGAR